MEVFIGSGMRGPYLGLLMGNQNQHGDTASLTSRVGGGIMRTKGNGKSFQISFLDVNFVKEWNPVSEGKGSPAVANEAQCWLRTHLEEIL